MLHHRQVALVLAAFIVVFTTLESRSSSLRSATWDESVHLTAGYLALTRSDYRLDLSHPPLLRMWAALPLAAMHVVPPDTAAIDRATPDEWLAQAYKASQQFVYRQNDADRLLGRARLMVVLLGIGLGLVLFAWVNEWLGFVPAVLALAFYTFEPNLLAHASLVTTDLGAAFFIFASSYLLWRACRPPHHRLDLAALAGCVSLAVVSKASGILLAPIVALLLAIAVSRGAIGWRRALATMALLFVVSIATIWAVYGFRYAPSPTSGWLFHTQELDVVQTQAPRLAALLGWIDDRHLLPNAFTQGLLYGQATAENLPAYLAGDFRPGGWWYYFPVAFVLKTPAALVLLLAAGLAMLLRTRDQWPDAAFVVVPPAVFLGFAMASGINIGVRHILPLFPFAIMIAARGASGLIASPRRLVRATLAAMTTVWLVMFVRVFPDTLVFFSPIVGGPANGHRYLADSNIDWGQHLKRLGTWMRAHQVAHINLAYFGTADPEYYGIDCTLLPGSPLAAANERPTLPGYVALSTTVLSGVYSTPAERLFYSGFGNAVPVADIGHSIRVYWVDRWPESPVSADDDDGWKPELALADSLLYEQGWLDHAVLHYRRYLEHRPDDATATSNLGIALLQSGQTDEALSAIRRAVTLAPDSAAFHRLLAAALSDHGTPQEAEAAARRALVLAPGDAVGHDLLGRALALQERWREAANEFSRALSLDPGFTDARDHLRLVWDAQGSQSSLTPAGTDLAGRSPARR